MPGLLNLPPGLLSVPESDLERINRRLRATTIPTETIRTPRNPFGLLLDPSMDSGIQQFKSVWQRGREMGDAALGLGPENLASGGGRGVGLFRGLMGIIKGVNPDRLSREILSKMNRTLKSKGYDVRGTDDVREIMKRSIVRNGEIHHPDYIEAFNKATGSKSARVAKAAEAKADKDRFKSVDWDRIRELGKTNDLKEAGYITPKGSLVDLSGKAEGGQAGLRSYDHREAGGTKGMQEIMAHGHIRMDGTTGSIDIAKRPTGEQFKQIRRLSDQHNGGLVVDLGDGLGEKRGLLGGIGSDEFDFYLKPERVFNQAYPVGTRTERIINDIKRFFDGDDPVPLRVP